MYLLLSSENWKDYAKRRDEMKAKITNENVKGD